MSNWQPSATLEILQTRSRLLRTIREFFFKRDVMEVETPLLCHTSVTDPFIESIPALVKSYSSEITYFLQTSPEYAMKRLLAFGCGSIYQISKAFRQGELGRFHNPEFTMLEWYRIGFDHHALMDEVDDLLSLVLNTKPTERISFEKLFITHLHINPHQASVQDLKDCAREHSLIIENDITDKDTWLQLLMSQCIEPNIGKESPTFVYDFPGSLAALSKIRPGNPLLASRFEVYFQGIELANGFHELQNAEEQRVRFENNLKLRKKLNLGVLPIDELFLSALKHGLPDCAGVALGIDRLIMLVAECPHLSDALSFDFSRV